MNLSRNSQQCINEAQFDKMMRASHGVAYVRVVHLDSNMMVHEKPTFAETPQHQTFHFEVNRRIHSRTCFMKICLDAHVFIVQTQACQHVCVRMCFRSHVFKNTAHAHRSSV